jgi:hypothetical protein
MVEKEKEKQSCNLGNVEMEDPFSFLAHPTEKCVHALANGKK